MIAPRATPTPIPAFAPVLRPEEAFGFEVDMGREASEVDCVTAAGAGLLGVSKAVAEAGRDCKDELDRCCVAVLADEPIVVAGVPAESNRNLPTPVSQQLSVWSQQ